MPGHFLGTKANVLIELKAYRNDSQRFQTLPRHSREKIEFLVYSKSFHYVHKTSAKSIVVYFESRFIIFS
jgi:hypothetical protein